MGLLAWRKAGYLISPTCNLFVTDDGRIVLFCFVNRTQCFCMSGPLICFSQIILCRRKEDLIIPIGRLVILSTEQLDHSGNWMRPEGTDGNKVTLALTESNGEGRCPVSYCKSQKITTPYKEVYRQGNRTPGG